MIFNVTCIWESIDDRLRFGTDKVFIEAESKEKAGELYEILLFNQGKRPCSAYTEKGYRISEILVLTEDRII